MGSRNTTCRITSRSLSVSGWALMLMLLVLEWIAGQASARGAVVAAPRLSLVVFTDERLSDEQWATLADALLASFENLAMETHFAAGGFDVVRGDTIAPGVQFEEVISIYLHGDCRLHSQTDMHTVEGALGWVLRDKGQIRPFIHVDCARIAEVLGQHVFGIDQRTRTAAMAEAISRVILHEWVHIATQNPAHSREGIEKRSFGLEDLVPDFPRMFSHAVARR